MMLGCIGTLMINCCGASYSVFSSPDSCTKLALESETELLLLLLLLMLLLPVLMLLLLPVLLLLVCMLLVLLLLLQQLLIRVQGVP